MDSGLVALLNDLHNATDEDTRNQLEFRIHELLFPYLLERASSRLRDAEAAYDAASAVMVQLLLNPDHFDAGRATDGNAERLLFGFLNTVLSRRISDQRRTFARRARTLSVSGQVDENHADSAEGPAERAIRAEAERELNRRVAKFRRSLECPRERLALDLVLKHGNRHPLPLLAEPLGVSLATACRTRKRVIGRLVTLLGWINPADCD